MRKQNARKILDITCGKMDHKGFLRWDFQGGQRVKKCPGRFNLFGEDHAFWLCKWEKSV